ncbi:hypothetical protein B0H63DRAFT_527639 [Podospora didyma]|uniref:Fucose-specific lectin n=1 Tax=Podospora didyma TaxID=330526 RepID=A0AAE0K4A8_9PEZI|nr:hypothetical protein B0H63DRAFT_527639 [Podospora didyma]
MSFDSRPGFPNKAGPPPPQVPNTAGAPAIPRASRDDLAAWQYSTVNSNGAADVAWFSDVVPISHKPEELEVYTMDFKRDAQAGTIQFDRWKSNKGEPWNSSWGHGRLSGIPAAEISGMTAVSRQPGHIEVFWAAPSSSGGAIQHAWWYEGDKWREGPLGGPVGSNSSGAWTNMTSVSRKREAMNVFWVGRQGSIQSASWLDGIGWTFAEVMPIGTVTRSGADIKAISRSPNHVEIFWVAEDHGKLSAPGACAFTSSIAGVAGILQSRPNSMAVFWISPQGAVWHASFADTQNWKLTALTGEGVAAPGRGDFVCGGITAVAKDRDVTDVYFTDPDGGIKSLTYWGIGTSWSPAEVAPRGTVLPGSCLSAISRRPTNVEIWFTTGPAGGTLASLWRDYTKTQ